MTRIEEIRAVYSRGEKARNLYDGVVTGANALGRFFSKKIWDLTPEEAMEYHARVFASIPADFNGTVLEAPVGTGVFSMPVWKTLPEAEITCLDLSENMLSMARERAQSMEIKNTHFIQGDVQALPFADDSFDAVVSINGFHVFSDKNAAFREIFRVLKPGGVFCGCFYCEGRSAKTDRVVRRYYVRAGLFVPPFETPEHLRQRLQAQYSEADVSNVKSIVCFRCVK